ncbi:MAG: metallophosphoesterase [bacterium]|nr:metallophosphoesterase [bacterium]
MIRSLCLAALLLSSTPAAAQKFVAFGDYGNGVVAPMVNRLAPEFIVTVGDNCYGNAPLVSTVIDRYYFGFKRAGNFYPALGNHDIDNACGGSGFADNYMSYFTLPGNERYYDFVRGNVHFFVLNSYKEPDGMRPTSKQGNWLKAKLAASTSPWDVVVFHHAPWSSGSEHGSTSYMRWPFEQWGADVVLSGHDHDYERVMKDANGDKRMMPYIVTGLGGQSRRGFNQVVSGSVVRYFANYGVLIGTATSTTLKFQFQDIKGNLIDTYSMTKSAKASTALQYRECC